MEGKLLLLICSIIMFLGTGVRRKRYKISVVKWLPLTISFSLLGLLGTYIMFFLENGEWYGQSFFGAVLFFPVLLIPVSFVFRVPLLELLDYATPPSLLLLAPFKLNCYMRGCCSGRVLYFDENGVPIHFPSQLAEMAVAIIIVGILLWLETKNNYKHKIYPICLILYGSSRLILNWFRWEQDKNIFGLTAGSTWSIISCCIGLFWLWLSRRKHVTKSEKKL